MAKLNQLKNVTHGLLGTFVSRNNDVGGYWGLGILRSLAIWNGLETVILDLMDEASELFSPEPLRSMERRYRRWLYSTLDKISVNPGSLSQARINVRFTTFDEFPKAIRDTRGDPYVCTTIIVLKNGKSAVASKIGVCAIHDAARESRSTRAN